MKYPNLTLNLIGKGGLELMPHLPAVHLNPRDKSCNVISVIDEMHEKHFSEAEMKLIADSNIVIHLGAANTVYIEGSEDTTCHFRLKDLDGDKIGLVIETIIDIASPQANRQSITLDEFLLVVRNREFSAIELSGTISHVIETLKVKMDSFSFKSEHRVLFPILQLPSDYGLFQVNEFVESVYDYTNNDSDILYSVSLDNNLHLSEMKVLMLFSCQVKV